jgi:16S rRNA (cytosine1402-N4)-methyltransferase
VFAHATVLGPESAALLAVREGVCVLDCTLGGGGHAELLLAAGARVIGLDRDPVALASATARLAPFGDRFTPLQANFRDTPAELSRLGVAELHGALADLGVSSPQLDDAARGFSFRAAGPLDMRMGPDAERVDEYLARVDERTLGDAIETYGEERFARRIARAIKLALPIADTAALAHVVAGAIPRATWPDRIHPATRTFQALRIAVNGELEALAELLASIPKLLAVGGRMAVISFHSLEDRAVKQRFAELTLGCRCPPGLPVCVCGGPDFRLLTRRPISAGDAEVANNPRARSAKLRGLERVR